MIAICIHVLLISAQRPRKPKEGAQDCVSYSIINVLPPVITNSTNTTFYTVIPITDSYVSNKTFHCTKSKVGGMLV